ncbi:MAG: ABC transporter permease [Candidatus Korarchaeota archaeon]|nr:ABC transporter permease [Candidatus Korarchaeota archaeon]NIU83657.1 ABC transporter permease subunit [Candidatus Thorarchaeota archaeon]NIW15532.1 ABC transporter permease subunit [Candidatus Thorarchaeota archaeon]NIW53478.1 ABC transporter permease subunit [Candidatus Korarchaeota archaeon]
MNENAESPKITERMLEEKQRASMWRMTLDRVKRDPLALFGIAVFVLLLVGAILAPVLAPYNPKKIHWGHFYEAPSSTYLLGTDGLGRDVLSIIIYGSRVSLLVGLFSVLLLIIIAIVTGSLAGYFGGWVDEVFMRGVDVILSIPSLILIILMVSVLQVRGLWVVVFAIGVTGWPSPARIIRSQFLSLKSMPYTEAAKVMGASHLRVIFKHILPNAIGPIIVIASFRLAGAILTEAALSFLGLADPTVLSWGKLVSDGRGALRYSWWISTFPGIAILVSVLGLNVLGDGLRRALDVRLRRD